MPDLAQSVGSGGLPAGERPRRVLFLTDGLLKVEYGIGKVARRNLDALNRLFGHRNVDVIALRDRNTKLATIDIPNALEVVETENNRYPLTLNSLLLLYNLNPRSFRRIRERIALGDHRLLFLDNSMYGRIAKAAKSLKPDLEIAVFYHDIKADLAWKWLKRDGVRFLPATLAMGHNERLATRLADRRITLNGRDASLLAKLYRVESSACLPVTCADRYDPARDQRNLEKPDASAGKVILFVGTSYYPNVVGARWFAKEVAPRLPGFRFLYVGKGLEDVPDLDAGAPNVQVIGSVAELDSWYYRCDAVIAPIFEGGGMKVKTGEALMFGRRVVGTREALEGYEQCPIDICTPCDTADRFVEALGALPFLHDDPGSVSRTRERFLAGYSDPVVDRALASLWPDAGNGKGAAG